MSTAAIIAIITGIATFVGVFAIAYFYNLANKKQHS